MPVAVTHQFHAASIAGKLYIAGGCSPACHTPHNILQVYDPAANVWATKAPMPTARFDAAEGAIGGRFYVVGGAPCDHLGCPPFATLEVYDPATDTWTTKAPMPTARLRAGAAVINGKLYVAGGSTDQSSGIGSAALEVYDPASDTWVTKAPMPNGRMKIGVGELDGILYAVSGWADQFNLVSTVEAYDPSSDTWTAVAPIPTARLSTQPQGINGVLYVAGGCCSPALEAFTPAPAGKADQTIDFGPLSDRAFGDPPFAISANSSSGLPVSFSASGSCTVSGSTVSLTGVGSCTITADQAGDDDFNPAPSVQQSFAVLYNTTVGHGFLQPINMPPQTQSVFKIGSTIPAKFQLFLADGVTPVSTAVATIQVNKVSSGVPSTVNETVTSTVPNQGITFRYDAGSQQYIFNLGTKSWTSGTYQITALLDDGSNITVNVGAR
jgi:N-acetylneuraminic acid mutarotase